MTPRKQNIILHLAYFYFATLINLYLYTNNYVHIDLQQKNDMKKHSV
jgi:hypothetical protein